MPEAETDSELVSLCVEYGDADAFERLVTRHVDGVYNFARSLISDAAEAEDVTQDTFLRAWKHIGRFDLDKSFKSWLFGIARNASIDFLRKKKTLPFSALSSQGSGSNAGAGGRELEFEDTLADDEPLADSLFEKKEIREAIESAIAGLPELYRPVVILKYSEGLTFEELAVVFGEPMNTIKSRYRRALALLKEELAADGRVSSWQESQN